MPFGPGVEAGESRAPIGDGSGPSTLLEFVASAGAAPMWNGLREDLAISAGPC